MLIVLMVMIKFQIPSKRMIRRIS